MLIAPTVPDMSIEQVPDLMTVAEVAEALRLSDETIHRWCRDGRLEYVDVFGLKRFHRSYIQGLLAPTNEGARP